MNQSRSVLQQNQNKRELLGKTTILDILIADVYSETFWMFIV